MVRNTKLVILDMIIINFTTLFALYLRFDWNIPQIQMEFYYSMIIPMCILIYINNRTFDLYTILWKYASIDELFATLKSVTLFTIEYSIVGYFLLHKLFGYALYRFPYSIIIISWMLNVVMIGGSRFFLRMVDNNGKYEKCNPKSSKNTLIIGAGDAGSLLIKELKKHKEVEEYPVAVIDDDLSKAGKKINGVPIVGDRTKIKEAIENFDIEEVIMAIPTIDTDNKKQIFDICKEFNVKLKTIPGIYEIVEGTVNISKIRNVNIEDLLGRESVKLDTAGIDEFIKGKVVLVTGGGGSIGSEICRQVAKFSPKKLIILDIYENNAYDLQMELNYTHPELDKFVAIASVRDRNKIEAVFNKFKPDVVFHAAAHKHVPLMEDNPSEVIKNNIVGTLNVAECASETGVKKFVIISTDKAVNPTSIMGASKRVCEMIIQSINNVSKTEFVAVRFGNVLGSSGSVIPLFKKQIENGGPVTVTHPDINRFFMTIPEASQLVIQAGAMAKGGEIFVLDMGKPVKIVDLARDLIKLSGLEPDKDIKIKFTGLRPGEKLYEEILINKDTLTKTAHNKIFVENPQYFDFRELKDEIKKLEDVSRDTNDDHIFAAMEDLVPTYKRKKN
ncbi:nucleoside-diphosphate sugar epimerase/dehydratase [Clostridium sp. JN-9]|uniref:polysaccharide biosynthesis protein n=1 Tax=Clostridium sp. JN-9 TaxID=2507159 RepID=UPI000FFE1BD8|nr:nucleoside-diphosphate sugar epimerase/dehydratase [Clostridium sp. JN-9]QAT41705.1 polysaccharide biosynthesis protein [Clostridium sp. JN-9]